MPGEARVRAREPVLIVGAGAMGRWVAETIDAPVAFADVDERAARTAADAVGGRVVPLEFEGESESEDESVNEGAGETESAETFAAVCLAVPMTHVASAIETHAPRAERAIFDVSGVMAPALESMADHAPDRERVSLHPLFAPERAPGQIAVVREESGPVTDAILADLEARGNDLIETTASEHDDAMETVQAAAHAAVLSFALAADPVPEGFETPVYDTLRELAEIVTGGTPRVYADIQHTFDGADDVAAAARELAEAEPAELEALYRTASERWDRGRSPDSDSQSESELEPEPESESDFDDARASPVESSNSTSDSNERDHRRDHDHDTNA